LHPVAEQGCAGGPVPDVPTPTEPGRVPDAILAALHETLPEWVAWPLQWQGQPTGWLLLGGTDPDPGSATKPADRERYVGLITLLLIAWGEVTRREERLRVVEEEARQRALVQQISTLVNSTLDIDEMLEITVREMVQTFQVDHSAVLLLDSEKPFGRLVAEYPDHGLVGRRLPVPRTSGYGRDLRAGRLVAVADVPPALDEEPVHTLREQIGLRSTLLLPLKVDTDVLGAISLNMVTTPRSFSPEETAAAQTVANQVTAAIVRARLFQEKAASEDYFRRVVEQAHDLIWTLDHEGRFIFANRIAEEVTGYRLTDWLGESSAKIIVPEDLPRAQEVLRDTLAGWGQTCELRIYDVVGRIRHLEVNTAPLQAGDEIIGVIGFSRDITDTREAETALLQRTRQAEKRAALLRSIGEVSRQVLALLNPQALLQSAVESLVKNLGYDFANVLLREGDDLVVRASAGKSGPAQIGNTFPLNRGITGRVARTCQPYLSNDVQQDAYYLYVQEWSETRSELAVPIHNTTEVCGILDVQSTARGAFDEADMLALGSLADQLGIALENTQLLESLHQRMAELELAQDRLSQAEKLSALGELIANAAHELNNPLTSVIGYAQLMEGAVRDPDVLRDLRVIVQAAQRAAHIVEDLLIFARQRVPDVRATDVNVLLQQTVALHFTHLAEEQIAVELSLAPELPPVRVDPGQLEQVFTNLIQNSRQALLEGPAGGHIAVRTFSSEGRTRPGQWIHVEVADNGPGIPEETLLRVFDPFFTTREEAGATGMGLSICYGIIVRHGGLIWAESEVGHGARFCVELPAWYEETDWDKEALI
jgi:PAS domain S-box-containing protein